MRTHGHVFADPTIGVIVDFAAIDSLGRVCPDVVYCVKYNCRFVLIFHLTLRALRLQPAEKHRREKSRRVYTHLDASSNPKDCLNCNIYFPRSCTQNGRYSVRKTDGQITSMVTTVGTEYEQTTSRKFRPSTKKQNRSVLGSRSQGHCSVSSLQTRPASKVHLYRAHRTNTSDHQRPR
jgi:hypothetical protein